MSGRGDARPPAPVNSGGASQGRPIRVREDGVRLTFPFVKNLSFLLFVALPPSLRALVLLSPSPPPRLFKAVRGPLVLLISAPPHITRAGETAAATSSTHRKAVRPSVREFGNGDSYPNTTTTMTVTTTMLHSTTMTMISLLSLQPPSLLLLL